MSSSWDAGRGSQGKKWVSENAGGWELPLVRSRLHSSLDSVQLSHGVNPMYQSGPLSQASAHLRPAVGPSAPHPGPRPETSPAHLALQSQVATALAELGGLDTSAFEPPPSEAPRATTASSDSEVVQRLREQLSGTDAVVKKLHNWTRQLESELEQLRQEAAAREEREEHDNVAASAPAAASMGGDSEGLLAALSEKEGFIEELQGQLVRLRPPPSLATSLVAAGSTEPYDRISKQAVGAVHARTRRARPRFCDSVISCFRDFVAVAMASASVGRVGVYVGGHCGGA